MSVVNNKYFDTIQDLIEKIEDQNSKLRFTYSKALKAIKSYPLLLRNGTEAKKEVNGVGEKIAGILNNLKCKGDGSPCDPETATQSKHPQNLDKPDDGPTLVPKKRSVKQREYIPSAKSGGYAILLTLFRHSGPTGFLNKQDIIGFGEQYCNSSFTMPKAGSSLHHTAWTSMTKLIKEDLVMEAGNPKRYSLTDAGMELATKLSEAHDKKISKHEAAKQDVLLDSYCTSDMIDVDDNQPTIPHESNLFNRLSNQPSTSTAPSLIRSRPWQDHTYRQFCNNPAPRLQQQLEPDINARNIPHGTLSLKNNAFFQEKENREMEKIDYALQGYSGTLRKIPFGSYEILLALDNREIRSRKDRDFFQLELEKRGVKVITIPLTLGDVCWVARSIYNHEDMTILDYIIERKGKDDLISSIMDGRFREQKHRLKKCGLPNIIYLVEEYDPFSWGGDALATALTETQILQGFFVKQCSNASETVEYLVNLTKSICSQHLNTPLCVMNSVDIQSDSFARLKQALSKKYKRPFYIPLSSFFTLTTKTKQLTHLDIWTKQLLTIRGVSSEKAILLVKKFKCLKDLIEKLTPLNEEERIQMIVDCGVTSHQRRQFGKALAKNIVASLFGDDH